MYLFVRIKWPVLSLFDSYHRPYQKTNRPHSELLKSVFEYQSYSQFNVNFECFSLRSIQRGTIFDPFAGSEYLKMQAMQQ